MSKRKNEFDLYRDSSTNPSLDRLVKGLLVLGEAVWAIISGVAGIAWKLLESLVRTEDKRKKS